MRSLTAGLVFGVFAMATAAAGESQCYGSVANGRIEHAVRLRVSGANSSAYSALGVATGRTYVHSRVAAVMADSYAALDFEAIAEHLYALHRAAAAHGIGIAKVIIDPPFLPRLFATRRGAYLKQHLSFMKRSAWVRHDEHYHVDFALPCKAL
ncbi:hypothetical protein OPU71_09365 [Niveibacterium sp. 24ML]|uniref:hypothetical protein n=1 Tax=Niveibacterium sp. 24ML TaxID=2985512 RepID=UPI002272147A|nr:hypothetical protein [Niveibacterium sp. 24ML]MCX9156328.1 hypothetical protein [Niveibacterium sp. 24ML]